MKVSLEQAARLNERLLLSACNAMRPSIIRVRCGALTKLYQRAATPERSKYGIPCEAWRHGSELVVLGIPEDTEDETDPLFHNCDAMGCTTFSHCIERTTICPHGVVDDFCNQCTG